MTMQPTEQSGQPPGGMEVVQDTPADLQATVTIGATDVWTPLVYPEEALNDSDKSITVTANQVWQILWIWIELITTVTIGDRQIEIQLIDAAADVIGQFRAGVVQAASLTRYYMFAPALADLLAFRDTDYLMCPFPPTVILPAGYQIRIWDNNAVDAAADDMIIQMGYAWKAE